MARLFDAYVMVDWSAANTPKRGADSIWYAIVVSDGTGSRLHCLENVATRAAATEELSARFAEMIGSGQRILAGFDFPFGFPAGTAARLGLRGLPWRNMWQLLSDSLVDGDDNASNRFDVAESLNRQISGEAFPFWGNVREEERPFLRRRGRRPHGDGDLRERRLCDLRLTRTQPVWKLAGVGAAGSQALTGIPRVWQMRRDPRLALNTHIWPFETSLQFDARPKLVLAEIYPSQISPTPMPGYPKDAAQVVAIADHLANRDSADSLEMLFDGDATLTLPERQSVIREEGWILGALAS